MDTLHEDVDQKIRDIIDTTGGTLNGVHINYNISDFYYNFTCCDGKCHGLSAAEILRKYYLYCEVFDKPFCINPYWHYL
jgi:hypothetical protein